MKLAVQLPASEKSPQEARRLLRERFGGQLPADTMYDLLTVVTELVANAVRHGSGKRIGVAVDVTEQQVRGEVQNKGTGNVSPRPVKLGRPGGLGLHIVEAIARRWDAQTNGVTRVSFELRRA